MKMKPPFGSGKTNPIKPNLETTLIGISQAGAREDGGEKIRNSNIEYGLPGKTIQFLFSRRSLRPPWLKHKKKAPRLFAI